MEYQTLNIIPPTIQKWYRKNPRRSISATFRHLRKSASLSFFGDYPLLAEILRGILSLNLTPSRQQIRYALNQSEELRCFSKNLKIRLLEQLINPSPVALKSSKNASRRMKSTKTTKYPSEQKES